MGRRDGFVSIVPRKPAPRPHDGGTRVATFDGQIPAAAAADEWEQIRADRERELELDELDRTMRERSSSCG